MSKVNRGFGHSDFRRGQWEPIRSVLGGHDALVVMPTGSGKSIVYQLPALMLKGLTIVGPLPTGIDLTIVYAGAAVAGSDDAAVAFVKFMAAPENRAAWKNAGFDPAR